jgi:quinol monooxygenase YgiN
MGKLVARPGRRSEVLEFLRWDAEVARAEEPGTLRFDVWEVPGEPDAFYLYEAYVDRAAFDQHMRGEPFKRFMAEIVPQMLEPVTFVFPFADSAVSNADA